MKELRNCPYCNAKALFEQYDNFCMITCTNYLNNGCFNQGFVGELEKKDYMIICWNERIIDHDFETKKKQLII